MRWRDVCGISPSAEPGLSYNPIAMARRIGQLVLALLQCSAVLATAPADEALQPCGDAYYYPSKVHIFKMSA
jgi:hypothetical protein